MIATIVFSSLCGFLFSFILTNYHRYKLKLLELKAREEVASSKIKSVAAAAHELALLTRRLAYIVVMLAIPGLMLALSESLLATWSPVLVPFSVMAWMSWLLVWKFMLLENLVNPAQDNVLLADEMTRKQKEELLNALDDLSLAIYEKNYESANRALRKVVSLVFGGGRYG